MLMALTLLPLPDSPTRATVVCSGTSKLTPRTASCISDLPTRKDTRRSFTSIRLLMWVLAQFRVHRVAQCIGEQCESGDEGGHEDGGGSQLPPFAKHQLALCLGEHGAPADHV